MTGSHYRPGWALTSAAFGYAMALISLAPVSIAFPALVSAFGVEVSNVGWVSTSYLLSLTILALLAGRLGDLYGHRRIFVIGVAIATVAALACSFATTWWMLIAFRVVQGIGAALVSGNAMAIVANAFDVGSRGKAIGLLTTSTSIGIVVSTYLAGVLLPVLAWRTVFLVAAPVGVIALLAAANMGQGARPEKTPRLDLVGAALLTLTLTALVLSFSHFHSGAETFEAGWPYHSTMHFLTAFGLVLFIWWERRVDEPLIDLRVFTIAPFTLSILANACFHMTMMATSYMYPFITEEGFGLTATATAFIVMGNGAASTISSLGAGFVLDRTRSRVLQVWAICLAGLSLLGMAVAPNLSYPMVVIGGLSIGMASGIFQTTNNTFLFGAVSPDRRGLASGMIEVSRQYGHTLGITITALVVGGAAVNPSVAVGSFVPVFQQAMFVTASLAFTGAVFAFLATRRKPIVPAPALTPQAEMAEATAQ